jgi:hypothetical protein
VRKETYNLYIMNKPSNKKVDIEFGTYDNVSGITFIGYPHTQKVRKSNNFTVFGSKYTKASRKEQTITMVINCTKTQT